jgi:hypothetical protein
MELSATVPVRRLRLAPTHADVLFLAILGFCFLGGESGMARLLMDGDTGVHIRIGDWVREHGRVPSVDLFGWSKPAGTWYAYEWLAGVIMSAANSAAGLKAVVLMFATLFALIPAFVALHAVWRGASGVVLVPLVLLGTSVLNIHFLARPHVFTLLFLVIAAWTIERDRREPSRRIWLLIPLMALWANLHGGFFIVFPLLGLLAVGEFLEGHPDRAIRYAAVCLASAAATLANPYGWHLHAHILEYLRSDWVIRFVDEAQSPKFRSETMLSFLLLLFGGLAAAGTLFARRRYVEVLWILFLSYCALVSVRHTTVWVVFLMPIVAQELTRWWPATHRMIAFELRSMTAWPAIAVAGVALLPIVDWPNQFPKDLFPVAMEARHRELLKSARVFTTDQWADYLIWQNYPDQRVFMDARHNYYGEKIGNEFLTVAHGLPGWRKVQARYDFEAYLWPVDTPLESILNESPEWHVLDRDSRAVLFVRSPDPTSPVPVVRSRSGSPRPDDYRPRSGNGPRTAPASAR